MKTFEQGCPFVILFAPKAGQTIPVGARIQLNVFTDPQNIQSYEDEITFVDGKYKVEISSVNSALLCGKLYLQLRYATGQDWQPSATEFTGITITKSPTNLIDYGN